jgi:hypothetical protein
MPVLPNEAAIYGYEAENRHMVQSFLRGERPAESFADGVEVAALLMAAYKSAELGKTIELPDPTLETFQPAVAKGAWNPRAKRSQSSKSS